MAGLAAGDEEDPSVKSVSAHVPVISEKSEDDRAAEEEAYRRAMDAPLFETGEN